MPRSEALKEAQKRYRSKADKYEKIKKINTKSNVKRYANDEEFREKAKMKQREYYRIKKEKKKQEQEQEPEQDIKENDDINENEDIKENEEEQNV